MFSAKAHWHRLKTLIFTQHAGAHENGFVLVAVIWIAGLLALVTTALVLQVRSNTMLSRNIVFNTRAEFMADGLTQLLALQIASPSQLAILKSNGETSYCVWGDSSRAAFRIQDQAGLVDLNTAAPQLLQAIFVGIGMEQVQATQFYDELVDFRDADSLATEGGEEPSLYPKRHYGPKNAPFQSVEELGQLPQINDDRMARLRDLVTVYSQSPGVDGKQAPGILLQALGASGPTDATLQPFISPSPFKTFSIDVLIETKEKARFLRHAIIALQQQPGRHFAVLAWQQGVDASGWAFPVAINALCFN